MTVGLRSASSSHTAANIKRVLYYGTFIHTPKLGSLQVFTDTGFVVDKNGVIDNIYENTSVEEILNKETNIEETFDISKNSNSFFFPGFIDTHIHAPQYPNNGIFGSSTLLDWLETYTFPLESTLKDLDKARLVYNKVISRGISHGTTCAAYYATIDTDATNLLADLALEKGQRAFIGKVCMNNNSPEYYCETFEQSKKSTLDVIDHIKEIDPSNEIVAPILTPRFAPSCTSELLNWLGHLREEQNLHCQTHISENKNEIKWVQELFPSSKSYTDVYNDHNLLGDKTILAHAIHLSDHEKDLIKSTGTGISHCPISNSSITSGEARVRWLLDNEIPVGLGTDVSGGFSISILETARQALLVSNHLAMKTSDHNKLSVEDVLFLATLGGAKVVGLQDKLGSFIKGKKWDAQLVDLDSKGSPVDVFDWQTSPKSMNTSDDLTKFKNLVAKWVFNGDDRNTQKVWVNGLKVHEL
ncbi:putative guanine deaminase [Wickerhamomyces ciferrii]|uniref:Guanine deaminase n=1 Tax=Wickerhamomyces ciferrii (strain ATCC 14091 / BCRC 22168 / CBS 111 / JCM 3599 / NBRC 0793 / NRRL Y-1031 F-60-10) TaxID=1206466 RepID=K0KK35_WICCF|nr:putative guanine deaminase [Wickerhamomyces ciferrii]CCH41824.1 putative guanine deaminase [Wickerhamomyces ciferrii]